MNLDQARLNNIYEEIVEIIRKELCGSSGVGDLAELLHNEFSNAGSFFFLGGGSDFRIVWYSF
jgi:hypothetical protein